MKQLSEETQHLQNVEHDKEQAQARLADAHCLLQEAAAAVDPETWPELSVKLLSILDPCDLPQCKHAQEAFAARDAAEARLLRLAAWIEEDPQQWVQRADVKTVLEVS